MKNRLKEIRAKKGLTQEALADLATISRPTLAMIEIERAVPDGDTIIKLVKALRLSAEEIFPELGFKEQHVENKPEIENESLLKYEIEVSDERLLWKIEGPPDSVRSELKRAIYGGILHDFIMRYKEKKAED